MLVPSISVVLTILFIFKWPEAETSVSKPNLNTIRVIQVIFRHGFRTIDSTYPTDPYKDESYWAPGYSQLNNEGKLQGFELGTFLRKRYGGFIKDTYDFKELYVLSSDYPRTIQTAYSVLAGLYMANGMKQEENQTVRDAISRDEIEISLPWTSVPVHSIPEEKDNIIRQVEDVCPKYLKLFHENIDTYPGKEERDNVSLIMYKNTGVKAGNFFSYRSIYDTLVLEAQHNMTLPPWANELLKSETAQKAFDSLYSYYTSTSEMKRLRAGPLLKILMENIKKNDSKFPSVFRESCKGQRKMYLFSGHDATMYTALHAVGINERLKADYCSAFILEYHEDESMGRFVELYYRNGTGSDPFQLIIPRCGHPCTLQKFKEIVGPYIPLDWQKECQVLHDSNTTSPRNVELSYSEDLAVKKSFLARLELEWIVAIFLLGCIVINIVIECKRRYWKLKRDKTSYD